MHITKAVKVGRTYIGGGHPVTVQTMTNTDTHDRAATLAQVRAMEEAGADIVRLAVPDKAAAGIFSYLKEQGVSVPLVADIHFDYHIALESVAAGADKIRINPGNIGDRDRVKAVADACRTAGVPIRVGVNAGSLEAHILEQHGRDPLALVKSAEYNAHLLEHYDFTDIVLSVKASSTYDMILANRLLAQKTPYPIHLGVTEAGSAHMGTVKSAIGIGTCLAEDIGDTIRVSLTADPLLEVKAGRDILAALCRDPLMQMDIVSCPTCGRTKVDLIPLLAQFEEELDKTGLRRLPLRVAFMGCVVNGPGEAREADIGVAGGIGEWILFKRGEVQYRIPEGEVVPTLIAEIRRMAHAE